LARRYLAALNGHEAELTYSRMPEKLIIVDHTGVADELRGCGVGRELALHAVEDARGGGWKTFRPARSSGFTPPAIQTGGTHQRLICRLFCFRNS
jgi:GNAT superfamily N-acetyltransferase